MYNDPGNPYLEHVKTFVLDHLTIVPQQVHAQLQVIASVDILRHDVVVYPMEKNLAQKFEGLPLRDVGAGLDEDAVVC